MRRSVAGSFSRSGAARGDVARIQLGRIKERQLIAKHRKQTEMVRREVEQRQQLTRPAASPGCSSAKIAVKHPSKILIEILIKSLA